MAYQICISKTAPCILQPITITGSSSQCIRTLEVYGCTPDLTVGENGSCVQGTYLPVGCCCAFTVPSGVSMLMVELWGAGGGGGSGASAICCGNSPGAGAGTYVRSNLAVSAGDILTICAGAGGCYGPNCEGSQPSFCCCGAQGGCSFIKRNGNMCVDAWGGNGGVSQCYLYCGCYQPNCGSQWGIAIACGGNGCWSGCVSYSSGIIQISGPSMSFSPGCGGEGQCQHSISSGSAFGGDPSYWLMNCNCWHYTRFNTGCTNSAGIVGPGGDCGPTGQAYNTPGSTQYACSSSDNSYCARNRSAPPGNFPGGGGASGGTTTCCYSHSSGGAGASGFVRIQY